MTQPYLDVLDVSHLDQETRAQIAGVIVPKLLTSIDGCRLSVGVDFDNSDSIETYHAKRDDHGSLYALLRSDAGRTGERRSISLFLQDGERAVGCVGSALFWSERSLAESLETWDSTAKVTSRSANQINAAHVVYSGGGHVHKDYRNTGVYDALYHLLVILILTRWRWSWHFSLIREKSKVEQSKPWDPLYISTRVYDFMSVEPFVHLDGVPTYLVVSSRAETWRSILAYT